MKGLFVMSENVENGKSFVFYESFLKGIELLPEEEQLKAFKLIAQYGIRGELPEGDQTLANVVFVMAQPNIDAAKTKRANGAKGGRPTKENSKPAVPEEITNGFEDEKPMVSENKNHRLSESESNVDVNVNVNVNEDVNVNDNGDVNVNVDEDEDDDNNSVIVDAEPEIPAYVKKIATDLFRQYCPGKKPSEYDLKRVAQLSCVFERTAAGHPYWKPDKDKRELLEYAFEQAAQGGNVSWNYIDGIYNNFRERGIKTRDDVSAYNFTKEHGMTPEEFIGQFYG